MLQPGDEFRHKYSYTQDDVDTYARVSGDNNPLHLDPAAGKASMFWTQYHSRLPGRECIYQDIRRTVVC